MKIKNMKKILITGGAGFIGSHLVDILINKGFKVIVVDNLSNGKKENINKKAKFYKLDILSSGIRDVFQKEKPEIVVHLAAQINLRESLADPLKDAKINILGSLRVIEESLKTNVQKFIFASSGGALYSSGPFPSKETSKISPSSPYGIAKMTVEKYLEFFGKSYGLDWISLRLSNVYGPRQRYDKGAGVVAIFIYNLLHDKEIIIYGSGEQKRDFIYVEDVVSSFLEVVQKDTKNLTQRCFNVGTKKAESINNLLKIIAHYLQKEPKVAYLPFKEGEMMKSCLDNSLIKNTLRWSPKYNLREGILKTIRWYQELFSKK